MASAVEAAGTFVLVFTVGSPAAGSNPWAPLAIGASRMGGQNPTVTIDVAALVAERPRKQPGV